MKLHFERAVEACAYGRRAKHKLDGWRKSSQLAVSTRQEFAIIEKYAFSLLVAARISISQKWMEWQSDPKAQAIYFLCFVILVPVIALV